ncbi:MULTISPECIES: DUF6514 family protein [Clostridium]|jgi:hypothetical protein|uniref:Uncharacterized protein n=3 Tax=Clostridium intestinale TaxID=36845 RepID=U2PZG1_9CLOT|nr:MULTISPECIES: DUF6514 family protein [Clostridium]ERK29169.1 hypothetical protein CINTURNW_3610 [Clostridium intestinale URNW]QLY80468.1 hypothetical protein HZF06_02465 [Clostridium intestinale]WRY51127.1 DUF6514 family protein [Clostridium intestinale]SHI11915.1 hypothetical protein SAMN02745941_02041 [Clostridium intestinale DSM 6191]
MIILKNEKVVESVQDNSRYEYSYRLVKTDYRNMVAYGIEVERMDFNDENLINIERECINKISPVYNKVENMVDLLYKYRVSPIHLVDVLGETIDECVMDFPN